MSHIALTEFVRGFQNNSLLHGIERVTLLQKVVASAIAFSAPCYNGTPGEMPMLYRKAVLEQAIAVITAVNEQFIINTDGVLADVKLIWEGRYETLNIPSYSRKIPDFFSSLYEGNVDISDKYEYWVVQCTKVVSEFFEAKIL